VFLLLATLTVATPALPAGNPDAEARALIERWLKSQNAGDFPAYQALYAEKFGGVRRSGARTVVLDRAAWMKERGRSFKRGMTVETTPPKIEIRGDTVRATFRQTFQSGRYRDVGDKQIDFARENGALRIVREEMLTSKKLAAEVDPDQQALRRWEDERRKALAAAGPVHYTVTEPELYDDGGGRVVDERAGSAVVTERLTQGGRCTVATRELRLDAGRVTADRLMGEDCCDLARCAERTPGGWMAHLRRICGEHDDAKRVAALTALMPKRGVRQHVASDEGSQGYEVYEGRMRRADAENLCNLEVAKWKCPDTFGPDGRATCATEYPGESYEMTFRKTRAGVELEAIEGTILN
jgi:hypothetical protein